MRDARKSVGLALLFIALLYATAPAVAVFAKTNLIETVSDQPYSSMPVWFKNWEDTGLIEFVDKNGDNKVCMTVCDEQSKFGTLVFVRKPIPVKNGRKVML